MKNREEIVDGNMMLGSGSIVNICISAGDAHIGDYTYVSFLLEVIKSAKLPPAQKLIYIFEEVKDHTMSTY